MNTDFYKIRISPEVLKTIVQDVNYNGTEVGVYSAMTQMLSGGTLGTSLFTGLTIPILIKQNIIDLGYYSVLDFNVLQTDVVNNFVIFPQGVGSVGSYEINIQNTSDKFISTNLLSQYKVDFGDGSPIQNFPLDGVIKHTYPSTPKVYTIVVNQNGPWGVITVKKQITMPATQSPIILDPLGDAYFTPIGGSWSSSPISYKYLFTGDTTNQKRYQISKPYVNPWPFPVTGNTKSRLSELRNYSIPQYRLGPVFKNRQLYGSISSINAYDSDLKLFYTAYTIGDVNYIDYQNRQTIYVLPSSGITENTLADDLQTPIITFPEDFIKLPNGDIGCKSCNYGDVTIEVLDLLNATNNVLNPEYNNKVFVQYNNCYGSSDVLKEYTEPGTYSRNFCVRRTAVNRITAYYYKNDIIYDNITNPTEVLTRVAVGSCCEETSMAQAIVKEEFLLGLSSQPEVQSNIYIERGKLAPYEKIHRLGEVNNFGQLNRYGYGYFDVE
jgi:hypothetical protein